MKKSLFIMLIAYLLPLAAIADGFSVSSTKKVIFAPGNVQYHAGTGAWRFAPEQYAVVGLYNNIRIGYSNLNVWLDLFGWSTTSTYYGVSASNKDADYTGDFVDWGALFTDSEWWTPSLDEWNYIFNVRDNASQLWGEGGIVCNNTGNDQVNGLFLLPDDWELPDGLTFEPGFLACGDYDQNHNVYSLSQWSQMEEAGAVFLPNAGYRVGGEGNTWNGSAETSEINPETGYFSWVSNIQIFGYYWSSTPHPSNTKLAYYLITPGMTGDLSDFTAPALWTREMRRGNSVRLIKEYIDPSTNVSNISSEVNDKGAIKRIENGMVVIEKDGKCYNVSGNRLK